MKAKSSLSLKQAMLAFIAIFLLASCGSSPTPIAQSTDIPPEPDPTQTPIPDTPTPIPSPTQIPKVAAQGYHALAYDVESNKVILKPYQTNYQVVLDSQAWAFDLESKTWQLGAEGPPKGEGPLAYDVQSDQTILFIGFLGFMKRPSGQTWAYDHNTDTWTNMEPQESPYNLIGPRMAYDSESDKIILYGGYRQNETSLFVQSYETWAYDYDTNTWTNMEPAGDPPQGVVNYYPITYDIAADRVIVWICEAPSGGQPPECVLGGYDYNSNTWEQRKIGIHPAHSDYSAMVYDSGTGKNILFGGVSYDGEETSDEVWGYDYDTNTWTQLPSKNPPGARGWHAMVYHDQAGVIVLFGGGSSKNEFTDETWIYDPASGEWSNITISP